MALGWRYGSSAGYAESPGPLRFRGWLPSLGTGVEIHRIFCAIAFTVCYHTRKKKRQLVCIERVALGGLALNLPLWFRVRVSAVHKPGRRPLVGAWCCARALEWEGPSCRTATANPSSPPESLCSTVACSAGCHFLRSHCLDDCVALFQPVTISSKAS